MRGRRQRWLALLVPAMLACGDRTAEPPKAEEDAARPTRVFEPPPGEVRPVPPFAIRSDGVGPYLIGSELTEVLDIVPRGPRIELLTIDGVAEYNLVRAEDAGLLVGAERSRRAERSQVSFVAALAPKVAKTASGIGVGSSEQELAEALEGPVTPLDRTSDPMVREFASVPGVRFVVYRGAVIAVIVAPRPDDREPDRPVGECRTGGALTGARDAILEQARLEDPDDATVVFGCFTGADPEALVTGDDRVALVGGEPDRLRRIAVERAPELRYAAPIDVDADGRDELALVYFQKRESSRVARVELARVDAGKIETLQAHDVYEVSSRGAAWTGAHVDEVDLLVEVASNGKSLVLGGLYLHRVKGRVREVAPLIEHSRRLAR